MPRTKTCCRLIAPTKSGGKPTAVQTLHEQRVASGVAKRLDCGRRAAAFGAGADTEEKRMTNQRRFLHYPVTIVAEFSE